jgi:hypothetical protein
MSKLNFACPIYLIFDGTLPQISQAIDYIAFSPKSQQSPQGTKDTMLITKAFFPPTHDVKNLTYRAFSCMMGEVSKVATSSSKQYEQAAPCELFTHRITLFNNSMHYPCNLTG